MTALNLENNGKKFFEKKKDNFRIEITEKKEDKNKISEIDDELFNKIINNNKELEYDDFIPDIGLIEDHDNIPSIKNDLEEKDKNNNFLLELKGNNRKPNNDKINFDQNDNINYEYMDIPINPNFSNNSFLISADSSFCSLNSGSIEPTGNIFKKNSKSPFLKFMNKFLN